MQAAMARFGDADGLLQLGSRGEELWRCRLLGLKAKLGRTLVEDFLNAGNLRLAMDRFDAGQLQLAVHIADEEMPRAWQRPYLHERLHALRQVAELKRLQGDYQGALEGFEKAKKDYDYVAAQAQAHCDLGIGDCHRMLRSAGKARAHYELVKEYADAKRDYRVQVRVMRGLIELRGLENSVPGDLWEDLEKLRSVSEASSYRYGRIQYWLLRGAYSLREGDLESAETGFSAARRIAADTRLGEARIEATHAMFGAAEVLRMRGEAEAAARSLASVRDAYSNMGLAWGVEAAVGAIGKASDPTARSLFVNLP
jgi:tetratricopeptide (TPR) repeat protein